MKLVLVYLSTLFVFLALDGLWLGLAAGSFYSDILGDLMVDRFRIVPAVLFYLLYIAGIVGFVLPLARQRWCRPATSAPGCGAPPLPRSRRSPVDWPRQAGSHVRTTGWERHPRPRT